MNTCAICSQKTQLIYKSLIGYQQGLYYDVYFCGNCDASYTQPLEVDESLYNLIYSKAKILPGYDRYYRFAEDVLVVRKPLLYLAETEDTYWAISDYLSNQQITPDPAILEVGCGLGYLTYSLIRAGYNARGIDISEEAIKAATKKYGSYYACEDVYVYAKTSTERFDVIILTEVIEHIPNPLEFIAVLKNLLSLTGRILITTPNKDVIISSEKYWDTELPPVHLWWFSQRSFQNIGDRLGLKVSFSDFSPFQRKQRYKRVYNLPWRQQTLAVDGTILFSTPHNHIRYMLRRYLIDYGMLNTWQYLRSKLGNSILRENLSVSDRLCAILVKNDE